MRRTAAGSQLLTAFLLLILWTASASDVRALRFGAAPVADRTALQPLRAMEMADVLGAKPGQAWRLAATKLPDRCRRRTVLDKRDCDDDLRCGWLAARVEVARAWSGEVVRGKADAAAFLHRASRRLAVGGVCSKKDSVQSAWDRDRRRAAQDDALVHLALLVEHQNPAEGRLLSAAKDGSVRELIARASKRGLSGLDPAELAAHASELHLAWRRGSWLHAHPVISRLRATIPRLWKDAGPIPEGCGDELMRPELLDDQWRGYVVREVISKALICVAEQLPAALETHGFTLENPEEARIVAKGLATVAARDRGGRNFSSDAALLARVDELEALYRSVRRAKARAPDAARRASPRRAKARPPAKPRGGPRASKPSTRHRPQESASRSTPGRVDQSLVRLARRVQEVSTSSARLVKEARQARNAAAQKRVVEHLVIAAHRALCAPLANADQADLDVVRKLLSAQGFIAREGSCDATAGRDSLNDLLAAGSGLKMLAAAARMRTASREIAKGHSAIGRTLLDSVCDEAKGTTWIVLYAWAARQDGDPVTADRMLARLDDDTLDRLRASGSEEVARIVAHAWVSKAP